MCGTMRTKVHGTQKRKGKKRRYTTIVWKLFLACSFSFFQCVYLFAFLELRSHVDVVECRVFPDTSEFYLPLFLYRLFFLFILMLPFGIRVSFERQRYSTRSLYIKPNWMEIMLCRGCVAFRLTNTTKIHFMLVVMLIIVKMSRF